MIKCEHEADRQCINCNHEMCYDRLEEAKVLLKQVLENDSSTQEIMEFLTLQDYERIKRVDFGTFKSVKGRFEGSIKSLPNV